MSNVGQNFSIETLGSTLDDSAGECFDKIARKLGLGYPGGPEIAKRSMLSDNNSYVFPRPMIKNNNYNFSFSGLKTHIINLVQNQKLSEEDINNVSAELQDAIVEVLIKKSLKAAKDLNVRNIVVTGGVSANKKLREEFSKLRECKAFFPDVKFSTDNGAMIAYAGYLKSKTSDFRADFKIKPDPSLSL